MKVSRLDKVIWFIIVASLSAIVVSYITKKPVFNFKSLEVVEGQDGHKLLKIHRVLNRDASGVFILRLDMKGDVKHGNECTVLRPNDILESDRVGPFLTRFMSRFKYVKCRKNLKEGDYILTATYIVESIVYRRQTNVTLRKRDFLWLKK